MPEKLLLVNEADVNAASKTISAEALDSYSVSDFKLVSKKKKDDRWLLKYKVGKGTNKRIFYLEVAENGNAILQDQPNLNNTTILYGKIVRTRQDTSL